MRVSAKAGPVRVSGHVGGRSHHHHHPHASVRARNTGRRGPWLRSVPPWRMPVLSGGGLMMLNWCILVPFFAGIWVAEASLLCAIWLYYGLFLGARSIYRNNVLGQTAETLTPRRTAARDPYAEPVDLAALQAPGDWDGLTRRRS